jgi:hypothetical protein
VGVDFGFVFFDSFGLRKVGGREPI